MADTQPNTRKFAVLCMDVFGQESRDNPKTTAAIVAFTKKVTDAGGIVVWARLNGGIWPPEVKKIIDQVTLDDARAVNNKEAIASQMFALNPAPAGNYGVGKTDACFDVFTCTNLETFLKAEGVTDIVQVGYRAAMCVEQSNDGGLKAGFTMHAVEDLVRNFGDFPSPDSIQMLRDAGANILSLPEAEALLIPKNGQKPGGTAPKPPVVRN